MFKMGGPIKEGVMHGIREPKNMGGRMLLVGQHPKQFRDKGGREHHLAPLTLAAPAAWTAARAAAMRLAPRALRGIKSLFGKTTPASVTRGGKPVADAVGSYTPVTINPSKFTPNWLGRDPLVKTVGATGKAIFNPTVGGWAAKGARLATSPSVLAGGAAYMFWPDGTPKTQAELLDSSGIQSKQKGPPGGGDQGMTYTDPDKAKKLAQQRKDERINSLLKTMGYDTAKKDAIGKALIDASQIVSERGTLDKKNIVPELINPIIQATSKRLEKPEQLNEAVRLMMTKAEIEKEMNPLDSEVKRMQIAVAKKKLAGPNLQEAILAASKDGPPMGETLAGILRRTGVDSVVLPIKVGKDKDTLAVATEKIKETWTNPEIPRVEPGIYVVRERIIEVKEDGSVNPVDV